LFDPTGLFYISIAEFFETVFSLSPMIPWSTWTNRALSDIDRATDVKGWESLRCPQWSDGLTHVPDAAAHWDLSPRFMDSLSYLGSLPRGGSFPQRWLYSQGASQAWASRGKEKPVCVHSLASFSVLSTGQTIAFKGWGGVSSSLSVHVCSEEGLSRGCLWRLVSTWAQCQ
jgi:hypothetical protein